MNAAIALHAGLQTVKLNMQHGCADLMLYNIFYCYSPAACCLQILEQDLPSGVPIVLLISDIRTRSGGGSSSKPDQRQQPQQQQGPSSRSAAAADTDVVGMQLSDGWYYVNTMIDGPTADLIVKGKLQVGL